MKRINILSLTIAGIFIITGCVSTKKYETSLSNINALETEKEMVEETLNETQGRLAEESAARAALEDKVAGLQNEIEELNHQKESLFALNNDLNDTIGLLSDEKLTVLKEKEAETTRLAKEKEREIARLSEEKQRTLQEKELAIAKMKQTYDSLVSELNDEIKKGEIAVTQLRDKLSLSMVDKILFDSGR
jgi:chemotaxis protein MotB